MEEAVTIAKASFRRCCASTEFFATFYRNFFARCPEAEPMFADTDFERQYKLLQHALHLLLIFPNEPEAEPTLLQRVARRHGSDDLDVPPEMYPKWVDSMLETVEEFDPRFDERIGNAWRKAMAPGVEYMRSRY